MAHEHSLKCDNEYNNLITSNIKIENNNFQSTMSVKMIKYETDYNNSNKNSVIKLQNSQVPVNSSNNTINNNTSGNASGCGGSTKMGSRRIFTPQFKLQVLESYRNDSDCKGNQRATARKYGIHRRQIQKWLQCESTLRSSVANLNQNNVKHQFHNISHQMPIVSSSSVTSISHTNNNNQQYKANNNILSLDTARHSVALTPITMSSSTKEVSSVAVAAASSSISPIHRIPLNGTNTLMKNPYSTIHAPTPYKLTTPETLVLTHTPASIASVPVVPVPIISHPHYHHHHHHQQQHHHHHLHHQLPLLHAQQHQQQQENERRPHFMPSASLPALSASSSSNTIISPTESNRTEDLICDYKNVPNATTTTGNRYINNDGYGKDRTQQIYEGFHYYNCSDNNNFKQSIGGVAPIDLSLGGPKRNTNENLGYEIKPLKLNITTAITDNNNYVNIENKNVEEKCTKQTEDDLVVDLTCRKRKNFNNVNEAIPEKVQKRDENSEKVQPDGDEQQQQAKPVKLFKPYLLDEDDQIENKKSTNEQQDPIIWSHHPNCMTPGSFDGRQCSSRGSTTFQSSIDGYPFPAGSPIFQGTTTATATTTIPIVSPSTTPTAFSCPKGSPVSGYESSSSTYSESANSDYYNNYRRQQQSEQIRTYSIDLKMQPIDNGYYYDALRCHNNDQLLTVLSDNNLHRSHVQKWLDQDNDIRQGIALYA